MTPPVSAPSRAALVEAGILRASVQTQQRLSDLIEEFVAADAAASEASERARHANSDVLDEEAERLNGEAGEAWKLVASGWAAGLFVPEDVLDLGREYEAARVRVPMPARAAAGDWRESVAAVDWSRGRP